MYLELPPLNGKNDYLSVMLPNYLFVVLLPVTLVCSESPGESCKTEVTGGGTCINIRLCTPFLSLLQGPRPLPDETVQFLLKAQCGFEGRYPLVCCPDTKPSTTGTKTTTESPANIDWKPFDVRNHPGLDILPETCGLIAEDKITGGNVTRVFEFPWMALLGYKTSTGGIQYRCGGSLITDRFILTAAHCVTFLPNIQLVEVRLGEQDLSTEPDCTPYYGCAPPVQDFAIEKAIPHPHYFKDELRNDIALIKIKGSVELTEAIQPICLPVGLKEQSKNLESTKVTVTGWGATELGVASLVLLKVDLPVVSLSECAKIYSSTVPVTERQICAGGTEGKDSCSGDSGGPLQYVGQPISGGLSYIQYGIVSFGPRQCGTRGKPGVYTRVGYYMDWILDNISG